MTPNNLVNMAAPAGLPAHRRHRSQRLRQHGGRRACRLRRGDHRGAGTQRSTVRRPTSCACSPRLRRRSRLSRRWRAAVRPCATGRKSSAASLCWTRTTPFCVRRIAICWPRADLGAAEAAERVCARSAARASRPTSTARATACSRAWGRSRRSRVTAPWRSACAAMSPSLLRDHPGAAAHAAAPKFRFARSGADAGPAGVGGSAGKLRRLPAGCAQRALCGALVPPRLRGNAARRLFCTDSLIFSQLISCIFLCFPKHLKRILDIIFKKEKATTQKRKTEEESDPNGTDFARFFALCILLKTYQFGNSFFDGSNKKFWILRKRYVILIGVK